MKKHLLILFVFLYIAGLSHASIDVRSSFFTINEGLADNLVRHIYQDRKGFIWMSTLNGLSRYDGYSFVTFRPEKGEHISLADRHVLEVSEDLNDFLWIKTSPGLYSCYDLKHNSFVDFTGCGEYKEPYTGELQTAGGDVWLWHYQNGCRKILFKDGRFSSVVFKKENGKLPSNKIIRIQEDTTGTIWICTQDGVLKVSEEGSEVLATGLDIVSSLLYEDNLFLLTSKGCIYWQNPNEREVRFVLQLPGVDRSFRLSTSFLFRDEWVMVTPQKNFVFRLSTRQLQDNPAFDLPDARRQLDNAGNLWLYNAYGRLRYINPLNGATKDFSIMRSEEPIPVKWFNVIQDSRGLFWIASYDRGLYVYNPDTDETKHYSYQPEILNPISSNNLVYIMEDRLGCIWISSESSGISCLTVANDGASHLYPGGDSFINQTSSIRMLKYMGNNEIWMGNRKGHLYRYDAGLNTLIQGEKYCSTMVSNLTRDASGKLWVATGGDGLCIDGRWYANDPDNPASLAYNKLSDLFCDYKQRMWIATFGGGLDLAIPDKEGKYRFRHFLSGTLSQQEIRIITCDENNWMWVGTDDGVCVFHPDSLIKNPEQFYRYTYDNNYLPGNEVKSVFYDSRKRIWLGTMGGGLSMCTPGNDYAHLQFTHYSTADGLINNMVQSIIEDREGMLWITTGYGISRFNPEKEQFENFLFNTSMLGNVYNENSSLLLSDGRLLFGTDHGLSMIDPVRIKTKQDVPNVVLTDLKVNGISVNPGDEDSPLSLAMSYTDAIQLKHSQNSFVVEFSTLDYNFLNGAKYTYLLEGYDKEWSAVSPLNFAAYKNLLPGNYTLHLKACNAVGVWSDKESILQLSIIPPFWKTNWAFLLYLLCYSHGNVCHYPYDQQI